MTETIRRITIQPIAIGNKTDHTLIADAIRSPTEGSDIGIIEAIFQRCCGMGCIGCRNAPVQIRIFQILVVVVGVVLPHRIGRIADNDADVPTFLLFHTFGIFR